MKTWQFLVKKIENNQRAILLLVIDNKGSSPGRKGFIMALAEDGQFEGTIGGGIMEVKLLELAKSLLQKKSSEVLIKQQFHDKIHPLNQSGMICSGEQTVAIIPLGKNDLPKLHRIIGNDGQEIKLEIQRTGIRIIPSLESERFDQLEDPNRFKVVLLINRPKRVHVFGGGHVGLALSQVLSLLDYYVLLYDDRPDLNTLKQNRFANELHVIDYDKIAGSCQFQSEDSVVIVTFSYRTDKLILRQLYQQTFSFIGMMGSQAKIETLFNELSTEGIFPDQLAAIKAPIGVEIFSKTAMEIAISIAGQMILEKNKDLPTGRK